MHLGLNNHALHSTGAGFPRRSSGRRDPAGGWNARRAGAGHVLQRAYTGHEPRRAAGVRCRAAPPDPGRLPVAHAPDYTLAAGLVTLGLVRTRFGYVAAQAWLFAPTLGGLALVMAGLERLVSRT